MELLQFTFTYSNFLFRQGSRCQKYLCPRISSLGVRIEDWHWIQEEYYYKLALRFWSGARQESWFAYQESCNSQKIFVLYNCWSHQRIRHSGIRKPRRIGEFKKSIFWLQFPFFSILYVAKFRKLTEISSWLNKSNHFFWNLAPYILD